MQRGHFGRLARNALVLVLAGLSALVLVRCYGSTAPQAKIGLIAPFEELYRADGYAVLHAVQLAISQRNNTGGVAGNRVALVALNDNGRPHEAELQAQKLALDPGVIGALGPIEASLARAAGPALAGGNLPWITWVAMEVGELSGGFSLAAPPARFGQVAVDSLAASGDVQRVAIFADQPSARSSALQRATELGLAAWASPASQPARLPDVDGVVWLGDAAQGADLVLAQPAGSALTLIGGPELGSPVFTARSALPAPWLSSGPNLEALPPQFVEAYHQRSGSSPSPQAVLAYDATNLLLDAMEHALNDEGQLTREAVRRALVRLGREGWTGLAGSVSWSPDAGAGTGWHWWNAPVLTHQGWSAGEGDG